MWLHGLIVALQDAAQQTRPRDTPLQPAARQDGHSMNIAVKANLQPSFHHTVQQKIGQSSHHRIWSSHRTPLPGH
eukprot:4184234-Amphidinium_carterae.1